MSAGAGHGSSPRARRLPDPRSPCCLPCQPGRFGSETRAGRWRGAEGPGGYRGTGPRNGREADAPAQAGTAHVKPTELSAAGRAAARQEAGARTDQAAGSMRAAGCGWPPRRRARRYCGSTDEPGGLFMPGAAGTLRTARKFVRPPYTGGSAAQSRQNYQGLSGRAGRVTNAAAQGRGQDRTTRPERATTASRSTEALSLLNVREQLPGGGARK